MATRSQLVVAVVLVAAACKQSDDRSAAVAPVAVAAPAAPVVAADLTQKYVSHNKLITAHYPAEFAAETVGKSVVLLSKNLDDGTDEVLSLMSVDAPISDELAEFDRVVHAAAVKELEDYVDKSSRNRPCLGTPGIEHVGTRSSSGRSYVRQTCAFLRKGHGYSFAITYPAARPELATELERIRDATEFKD